MARKKEKIDQNQLALDFNKVVDDFIDVRGRVFDTIEHNPATVSAENEFDLCRDLASVIDRCRKAKGLSRPQLADELNVYFGRTKKGAAADPPTCRKPLTEPMMNHLLSKYNEYTIPAYLLVAICHVLETLEPLQVLADPEGAKVISSQEIKHVQFGQLDDAITEMKRLQREIKSR